MFFRYILWICAIVCGAIGVSWFGWQWYDQKWVIYWCVAHLVFAAIANILKAVAKSKMNDAIAEAYAGQARVALGDKG